MFSPISSNAIRRRDLEEAVKEYDRIAWEAGLVGLRILPAYDTTVSVGKVPTLSMGQMLQKTNDLSRAEGGAYSEVQYEYGDKDYITREYGITVPMDDRATAQLAHLAVEPGIDAADLAATTLLTAHEKRVVKMVTGAGTEIGSEAATAAWTDIANGKPVTDIRTKILPELRKATGRRLPVAMVIGYDILLSLTQNQEIIDTSKAQGFMDVRPGALFEDMGALARALNVNEIIVAGSMTNATKNVKTTTFTDLWPVEQALFFQQIPGGGSATWRRAGLGVTVNWTQDGSTVSGTMEEYREEGKRSNVLRARHDTAEVLINPKAGLRLTGVAA